MTSYDIEKNGYGTCCIIGGHLRFCPETTCNMEVEGYYCSVLDILTIKNLYLATKNNFL